MPIYVDSWNKTDELSDEALSHNKKFASSLQCIKQCKIYDPKVVAIRINTNYKDNKTGFRSILQIN
jgi:hypothetical protein